MLTVESAGRIKPSARRVILSQLEAAARAWWHVGFGLEAAETGRPSVLTGSASLFRPGFAPEEDDLFMAFADMVFIVGRLRDWAARFTVKWHLRMHGDDWGTVDPTGCSKRLLDQMDKWAGRSGVPRPEKGRWDVSEGRRAEIAARNSPKG